MREYIDINLIKDICIQYKARKKRQEIMGRIQDNLGMTNLRLFFKEEDYPFSVYIENDKIYFDKSKFVSILHSTFITNDVENMDEMINAIITSDVLDLENILPPYIALKIKGEIEEFTKKKEILDSMLVKEEFISSFTKKKIIESSNKDLDVFKKAIDKEINKVKEHYNLVFEDAKKNNEYIQKVKEQMDKLYSKHIKGRVLNTYTKVKEEVESDSIKELTDAFVLENIHFEKLLYVSLVLAYQNNNQEYLQENMGKLTRGRISELTEKIIEKYHGKNKEFLKAMKEFSLAYGRDSINKEDLLIEGANIYQFNYNFLSLENKKEIKTKLESIAEDISKKYKKTQDDRYLVLLDKLQVIKELDIKQLYIGQNSFKGYIGYKEEHSNIMLDKYYEDKKASIPAINHACYVVEKKDFEKMTIHNKEEVIEMIKMGTIRAKRIYHDKPSDSKKDTNKKYFKEKVLHAMRNHL